VEGASLSCGGWVARVFRRSALAVLAGLIAVGGAAAAPRVVGGTVIPIQSAPWSVLVAYQPGAFRYICTGSVIDASHVLTAAHCLYGGGTLVQPSLISVEAGVSNFFSPTSSDAEQSRSVSSFRVHPGYVAADTSQPDDVAVLTLAAPLDLSGSAVRAVALPTANAPFPAGVATAIAGFGSQDPKALRPSGALVSMTGTVDPQNQCGEFTVTKIIAVDNAIILCNASTASAICSGDSGSGVVTASGTPVLVGVASGSSAECTPGSHSIFAYIGAPEILSFIQGNDQPPTAPRPPPAATPYDFTWPRPLVIGDLLKCSTSGWPASVQIAYSFVNTATGQVLQAGSSETYLVPSAALGATIACMVGLTNDGGTTLISAAATTAVEAVPQIKIQHVSPLSGQRGHRVLLRLVLVSPLGQSGTLSVCATPPSSTGGRVCRSTHKPSRAAANITLTLTLKIKATAPLGVAHLVISANARLSSTTTTTRLRVTRPK
jgi:hypothetical protein